MANESKQVATVGTSNGTVAMPTQARTVEVMNITGAGVVYVRGDGTAAVVDAANNDVIPAAVGAALEVDLTGGTGVLNMIASASTKVALRVVE